MISVSKADESAFRHLKWNQSPPQLAAHETTCQDLNGICNLREHVGADQDDGDGGSNGVAFGGVISEKQHLGAERGRELQVCPEDDAGHVSRKSGV